MRSTTCLKVLSVYFTSSSQSWRTRFPFRHRFNNILLMERVEWFADLVFCPWEAGWCHRCLAWHSWIFLSPQSLSAVKEKKNHYDSRRQALSYCPHYFSLTAYFSILALRFARNHSNRYLEVALGPACFVQRVSQVFVGPYCLEHVSGRLGLPCWLADNTYIIIIS